MDVVDRLRSDKRFLKIIYKSLMTNGTAYDGKERYTELLQGTLAIGENQNELQLGHIYKGDFHNVAVPPEVSGNWLIHTHGKIEGRLWHPPSISDIFIIIQRTSNNPDLKGISIIVAPEGFYIMFAKRALVKALTDWEYGDAMQKQFRKKIISEYGKILLLATPEKIVEYLCSADIYCEFIYYSKS